MRVHYRSVLGDRRVRLVVSGVLLFAGLIAMLEAYHVAWLEQGVKRPSGGDDVVFFLSAALAFGVAYAGRSWSAYGWILNALFAYWAYSNARSAHYQELYINGRHGCEVCAENVINFLLLLPAVAAFGVFVSMLSRWWNKEQRLKRAGNLQRELVISVALIILIVPAWMILILALGIM